TACPFGSTHIDGSNCGRTTMSRILLCSSIMPQERSKNCEPMHTFCMLYTCCVSCGIHQRGWNGMAAEQLTISTKFLYDSVQ
ncbi:unnamed protein product, partial [Ectocarpus fasciculatus]